MPLNPWNPEPETRRRASPRSGKDDARPLMTLDVQKYLKLVEDLDLTEAQKVDLIKTVWAVVESFVDQAFGVHPVQLCRADSKRKTLKKQNSNVKYKHSRLNRKFNSSAYSPGKKDV